MASKFDINNEATEVVRLSSLQPGDRCQIHKVTGKGDIFRRIMDIGIRPGKELLVERVAPLGDPVEFKLDGCHVSLRKDEAESILVRIITD